MIVFKSNASSTENPRDQLEKTGRYVFCHPLFGISEDRFVRSRQLTRFKNYELLAGREFEQPAEELSETERRQLETQIGLEYLVRMASNMSIEHRFKVIKVRNLLLNANAIAYDLEFLGTREGRLFDHIQLIKEYRQRWFSSAPTHREIRAWFHRGYELLTEYLVECFNKHAFFLEVTDLRKLTRNISVKRSDNFSIDASGLQLPSVLAVFGRKYLGLQHRLNSFTIGVPFQSQNIPPIVQEYLVDQRTLRQYSRLKLPNFMALATSLDLS